MKQRAILFASTTPFVVAGFLIHPWVGAVVIFVVIITIAEVERTP